MRKRHLKRIRQIGGTLVFLVVVAAVAEWVCREFQDALLDPKAQPMLAFHPAPSYTFKPHLSADMEGPSGGRVVIDINSLGIRDRDVRAKETAEFRIVALGDSETAATHLPLSDLYIKVLGTGLQADSPPELKYTTINAAVNGYNLRQIADLLAEFGEVLDPDLVLVGLSVADDIKDYDRKAGLPLPAKTFFRKKSYLYHALYRLYHKILEAVKRKPQETPSPDLEAWRSVFERYGESPDDGDILQYVQTARRELALFEEGGASEAVWSSTSRMLGRIRDHCRDLGARTVLVLLPTQRQALVGQWEMTSEMLGLGGKTFDLDRPQKRLLEIAADLEIPTVDLLATFRNAPNPDSLYYAGTRSLTAEGHRLAAAAIRQTLTREGILK